MGATTGMEQIQPILFGKFHRLRLILLLRFGTKGLISTVDSSSPFCRRNIRLNICNSARPVQFGQWLTQVARRASKSLSAYHAPNVSRTSYFPLGKGALGRLLLSVKIVVIVSLFPNKSVNADRPFRLRSKVGRLR